MALRILLPLLLGLSACVIGSDKYTKPRDLPQASIVDRLRVLAVKAEPPEARPGELVTLEGLIVDPNLDSPLVIWLACESDDDSGTGLGCAIDFNAVLSSTSNFEELVEAGVIGMEPGFSPSYTPPEDLLDNLAEEDRAEGLYLTIQVTAIPSNLLTASSDQTEEFDFNAIEIAYKRLIVSEADTPNENPEITGFMVNGQTIAPGQVAEIEADTTTSLEPIFSSDSVQTYEYTTRDGVVETREEEPYLTWYTSAGSYFSPYSIYPFFETKWFQSETTDTEGSWWVVVRDRRGGMTWHEQRWQITNL